jgi:hypothetical protein
MMAKSRIHGLATYDKVLIVVRATVRRCDKMFDTGFAAGDGFAAEETAVPLQKRKRSRCIIGKDLLSHVVDHHRTFEVGYGYACATPIDHGPEGVVPARPLQARKPTGPHRTDSKALVDPRRQLSPPDRP